MVVDGGPHVVRAGEADISENLDLRGEAVPSHPVITLEDVSERLDLVAIRQQHQRLVDPRTELSFCGGCFRGWPCLTVQLIDAQLAAQRHACPAEGPTSCEPAEVGELQKTLAQARAELEMVRARAASTWATLESIAKAPCLSELLDETKESTGGCDCPACVAQAAIATATEQGMARIARLEAVASAAQELAERSTRGGDAMARLRAALGALA